MSKPAGLCSNTKEKGAQETAKDKGRTNSKSKLSCTQTHGTSVVGTKESSDGKLVHYVCIAVKILNEHLSILRTKWLLFTMPIQPYTSWEAGQD